MRRATERRAKARSNAPGFMSLLSLPPGEPLRLLLASGEDGDGGEPEGEIGFEGWCGEPAWLNGGNHFDLRDGATGIVIRACIACVIGGASGAGNVGGSVLKSRNNGGKILIVLAHQQRSTCTRPEIHTHRAFRSSNHP